MTTRSSWNKKNEPLADRVRERAEPPFRGMVRRSADGPGDGGISLFAPLCGLRLHRGKWISIRSPLRSRVDLPVEVLPPEHRISIDGSRHQANPVANSLQGDQ